MSLKPNMGKAQRIAYVILGLAMMAAPFAIELKGWMRAVVPMLGLVTLVAGAVGL